MLTELTIRNLGVISEASLALGSGLTVVSGETGAGKTMVVSGLGMVTGARADSGIVRNHEGTAHVEARFTELPAEAMDYVDEVGGVVEDQELLVARQVGANGRSRSWVGGASVPLAVLRELDLVTIHGQSEQVRLSTPDRQREVLDRAAGPDMATCSETYALKYEERKGLSAELSVLSASARERAREADMLRYGLSEIEKVVPLPGEDAALAEEAKRLADADVLRGHAYTAMTALAGDDETDDSPSLLTCLNVAQKALRSAASEDSQAETLVELADEMAALATDLAGQVSGYLADLSADPVRLEWVESRLAELKALTRKYGVDATEVLAWAKAGEERLAALVGSDERIAEVEERIAALDQDLEALAVQMTAAREQARAKFGEQIAQELTALAMPHARVDFALTPLPELGPHGRDHVQLLFTANPGVEPAPLGKVASGGELSRVRLAIEVVLADVTGGATFVFDEVDAGIGGAVGLQVGNRLARLARTNQVVVVTHLAQVAAFADRHWVVTKTDDSEVTSAGLSEVSGQNRLVELARMMGGLEQTESSLAHAQELLDQAASMGA
ncbi:MAG: DNA repair protein RecN [Propionibacteriaceae bacterium]|jgi:DNA repair protein RecN (Recombination protein N)|nr:DNA repair protein RecN [Propionibacteriaceae bacterium]